MGEVTWRSTLTQIYIIKTGSLISKSKIWDKVLAGSINLSLLIFSVSLLHLIQKLHPGFIKGRGDLLSLTNRQDVEGNAFH